MWKSLTHNVYLNIFVPLGWLLGCSFQQNHLYFKFICCLKSLKKKKKNEGLVGQLISCWYFVRFFVTVSPPGEIDGQDT